MEMDVKLKKLILKPLVRRRPNTADRKALISAFERIDDLAIGGALLKQLQDVVKDLQQPKSSRGMFDIDSAKKQIALASALYQSRQISREEFVFFSVFPVDRIFDERMFDGVYDDKFGHINEALDKIRKEYGLKDDEDWNVGEGPAEYTILNKKWEAVWNKLFLKCLREFGLDDFAYLIRTNRDKFNELRERGRRALSHRDELSLVVEDIVIRYEEDAKRAAKAKAYVAAVVSLGAGLEGLLLLRCLRSKHKAISVAKKVATRQATT